MPRPIPIGERAQPGERQCSNVYFDKRWGREYRCTRRARDGGQTCEVHHRRMTGTRKTLIAKRTAAGVCHWCGEPRAPWSATYCATHVEAKADAKLLPKRALMYWMGQEACQVCGIADPDVLSIDHVLRNGTAHRKLLGVKKTNSVQFFRTVLREGMRAEFPLQTLCFNCHFKKDHRRGWYR
jgi:hypothetical protein